MRERSRYPRMTTPPDGGCGRWRSVACSAKPGDAVLLGGVGVGVGPDGSRAVSLGKLAEEALESGGGGEDQYPAGPRHYAPLGMRNAARGEHDIAGASLE